MIDATNQTAAVGGDGASLELQDHSTKQAVESIEKEIPIHWIQTEGTQTRAAGLNPETVTEYATSMEDGASFPKPVVYSDGTTNTDGTTNYWLGDGAHRVAAAKKARFNHITCEVRSGGQRDALRHSLQANVKHGLRRTNADKWHAVGLVLADEEWRGMTDRAIAAMCLVSPPFVATVRASVVNGLQQEPDRRTGSDGKSYAATKPKPQIPVSETAEDADEPANVQQIEQSDDLPADADEFDTAKLEAGEPDAVKPETGISEKMLAAAKGPKSKNGKPVVCSLLIEKVKANLSELCRQLTRLGLKEKHQDAVSAIIRDVKALANQKPAPVAGPVQVDEPVPF